MSLLQIIYVGILSPYSLPLDNRFELFNEATILLVLTASMRYADSPFTPEFSSNMGFALIGLIVLNIAVNMLYFLVEQITFLWDKIREIKCVKDRMVRPSTVQIAEIERDYFGEEEPYSEE